MVFKNLCIPVIGVKVALVLIGLDTDVHHVQQNGRQNIGSQKSDLFPVPQTLFGHLIPMLVLYSTQTSLDF